MFLFIYPACVNVNDRWMGDWRGWRRRGMTIGWTTKRDGKEMPRSIRDKHTKRKMQEGILNDRPEL
jgi:hypothetical protein